MKENASFFILFGIFTGFLGSAVAIDWGFIDQKYWSGILIILLWAVAGLAGYLFFFNDKGGKL